MTRKAAGAIVWAVFAGLLSMPFACCYVAGVYGIPPLVLLGGAVAGLVAGCWVIGWIGRA